MIRFHNAATGQIEGKGNNNKETIEWKLWDIAVMNDFLSFGNMKTKKHLVRTLS